MCVFFSNMKILLSLMPSLDTYDNVTTENNFLEIYYLRNNHLWAKWTRDSTINGAMAVKSRIKNLADHLSVSTRFVNHQIVFLLICVQFRDSQACSYMTRQGTKVYVKPSPRSRFNLR